MLITDYIRNFSMLVTHIYKNCNAKYLINSTFNRSDVTPSY